MKPFSQCLAVMLTILAMAMPAFAATPVATTTSAPKPGAITLESGTTTTLDGETVAYEIGTLSVPENRQVKGSRMIGVGFARVRATHPTGAPPIFLLAGGPGVTMLDIVVDRDDAARRRVKAWADYARVADLVVIEQRGYSLRGDMLELPSVALPLDRPMTIADDTAATRDLARRTATAFPGKDLAGYTVIACAEDVNDLRRALGYDRISLVAASFGSQWGFAVMKTHPEIVSRAVLSAVEPLDYGYDMPSPVFAAIKRIAVEADRDPALRPYLPEGGVIAAATAVRDRLAAGPIEVAVTDEGGTPRKVVLGLEDFQLALISWSQAPARFPAAVLAAFHGHYEPWARDAIEWRKAGNQALINPLINTSLGMTPARQRLLWSDPALPMLGSWNFASYLATANAKEWPTTDLGDAFRTAVPNATPVLFVHGDWDTSTPIDNSLAMLPWFANGHLIRVHRGPHTGALALLKDQPAVAASVYEFLRTGKTDGLPSQVDMAPVVFAKPDFAPPEATRQ